MLLVIMRKSAMILLAVFGFTAFALAQNQTVRGTVSDKKRDILSKITLNLKGTKITTSKNAQGVFRLDCVLFSVGYYGVF